MDGTTNFTTITTQAIAECHQNDCIIQTWLFAASYISIVQFNFYTMYQALQLKEKAERQLKAEIIHSQWLQNRLNEGFALGGAQPDPDLNVRPCGPRDEYI